MGLGIHLNEDMGLMIFSDTPVCTRHREGRFRSTRNINLIINSVGKNPKAKQKQKQNKTKRNHKHKMFIKHCSKKQKHKAK